MNDPHVVRLKYKLVTGDSVSYHSPLPVVCSNPGFDLKLENGVLTVDMKEHHATVGSAIERIRPDALAKLLIERRLISREEFMLKVFEERATYQKLLNPMPQ